MKTLITLLTVLDLTPTHAMAQAIYPVGTTKD